MTLFSILKSWSFKFTMGCAVVLITVMGYRFLMGSHFLALKHIRVQTDGHLDCREVLSWVGIRPRSSLLDLRLGQVKERIEKHPLVERVRVERVFPDSLEIKIRERQPVAKVVLEERSFLMDRTGTLFAPLGPKTRGSWVPLTGLSEADFERNRMACERILQAAVELLVILKGHGKWQVKEVGLDLDRGLCLALAGGPYDIRLGFGDLRKRMGRLGKILNHLSLGGLQEKTQWIDLRYTTRAAVKFNS